MSMGGGQGGQAIVQTGPTIAAANEAANAQISASEQASQMAALNTNSAINALMGEYGTALQYQMPAINTGNQAAAQMNYMLGLPAVNPGTAPTAPTITQSDIQQYIANNYANPTLIGSNGMGFTHPEYTGYVPNGVSYANASGQPGLQTVLQNGTATDLYNVTGGANQSFDQNASNTTYPYNLPAGIYTNIGNTQNENPITALSNDPTIAAWAKQAIQNDPTNSEAYNTALTAYNQQNQAWNNQENLYNQYNAKGQATSADIGDIVQNLPGFQFQSQQGIQGIQNAASASGMLNSGSLLQQLDQFGQGLASTYYGNYLNQLGSLAGMGQQATQTAAAGASNLGNSVAGLYSNLGDTQANSALAAGQAMASSYLSPLQNQQQNITMVGGGGGGLAGIGGVLSGLGSLASSFCDEQLKDKIETPSTAEILDSVQKLRLDKWKYKGINEEHIGPYAQEFKDLFKVGDGQSINLIDLCGVMLGSIKELTAKVNRLERGIK